MHFFHNSIFTLLIGDTLHACIGCLQLTVDPLANNVIVCEQLNMPSAHDFHILIILTTLIFAHVSLSIQMGILPHKPEHLYC